MCVGRSSVIWLILLQLVPAQQESKVLRPLQVWQTSGVCWTSLMSQNLMSCCFADEDGTTDLSQTVRLSFQAPQAEPAEERPFAAVQTGLKGAAVVVDGVLRALKVSPFLGVFATAVVLQVRHAHSAIAEVLKHLTQTGQS